MSLKVLVPAAKIANVPAQIDGAALKSISPELYDAVMQVNAEPTSRLLPDGDDRVEFAQQVQFVVDETVEGDAHLALCRAIFFQPRAEVETREDLSDLKWVPDHYEIVD